MLTNYEREVATTLVEALVEYGLVNHLAPYGKNDTEEWFGNNNLFSCGFWTAGGLSKVCIRHSDLPNWVIKVGYIEEVSCDYATIEYNVYCNAVKSNLERYFPKTFFLGNFGGRAFYVQELAECDENEVFSSWYNRLEDIYTRDETEYSPDDLCTEIDCLSDLERIELMFDDPALCQFLRENDVGDFHEGNFGFIGDRIVIVDFSGWHN